MFVRERPAIGYLLISDLVHFLVHFLVHLQHKVFIYHVGGFRSYDSKPR